MGNTYPMMKKSIYFLFSVLFSGILVPYHIIAQVEYDASIPQVAFAAGELERALAEAGQQTLHVTLSVSHDRDSPEAFEILLVQPGIIEITGSDANGAMYGGIELAERIRLGLPVENVKKEPFVRKRGMKFNIPWDARTPSYDDTGDNAQNNIETVWDIEFWKAYLDDLARYRYNVLSLWSTHPYPSIIQLDDFPEVALDDVYRVSEGVFKSEHKNRLQDVDLEKPGTIELVKKIPIEDKIKYWQMVFEYAGDRGIEIYLFHWNVMTFGATGKHGITPDQTNPVTNDYMRECVREALKTYPQIAGIGVTAGENADNHIAGQYSIENFLFNTYGRGIMDVLEQQPERNVRFIFRRHMTGLGPITTAFEDFPDKFETSFKYAIGHMYTGRHPQLFDRWFRDDVEKYWVRSWLNLRNDDMFVLRWGNPDYVRDYIQLMPHDVMAGFYMGSDGYVWGREFISKNPETSGKLEIDKHWYRFRMWGELAYDPNLGRDYWEANLRYRFPGIDPGKLYDAWAATGEIIPLVNNATFCPNDAHLAPEGCIDRRGFLTIDDYNFSFWPMIGSGIHSVQEWGEAIVNGDQLPGITPFQVADQLDTYAARALALIPDLRAQAAEQAELTETLNDIEAMAYLGRYYADKMRGAAKLAAFRVTTQQKQFSDDAVAHLEDAVDEWKAYTAIVSSQYRSQLMQRTSYMDWESILSEVEQEVETVRREGDAPEVHFTNLSDGIELPAGTDLRAELVAEDADGIREIMLYFNGLKLKPHRGKPMTWSEASDPLLKGLAPGVYELMAVAEDHTGTIGKREIQITIGSVSEDRAMDWQDEIHQVILEEGDIFTDEDVFEFPRLECFIRLRDDGRLILYDGSPENTRGMLWKAMMHNDHGAPHFVALERGQLVIYRGTPGNVEATPYTTPEIEKLGTYLLGITAGRSLVIVREDAGGKREIVWKSEELEPWRL